MLVPFTDGLLTPVSADVPPSRIISLPRSLNQSSQCVRDSKSRLCEYSSVFSMNVTICGSVAATLFRPSRVILFFGKGIDIGRSGRAGSVSSLSEYSLCAAMVAGSLGRIQSTIARCAACDARVWPIRQADKPCRLHTCT